MMAVNVLSLFTIPGVVEADRAALSVAFVAIKTRNVLRASQQPHPGFVPPDIPDNAAIAGPQSDYDFYV
jgi:hypothetical protein